MTNRIALVLVLSIVFMCLSAAVVSAQQLVDGGSVGVRSGEIAQAVIVALTSLLMAWLSRG